MGRHVTLLQAAVTLAVNKHQQAHNTNALKYFRCICDDLLLIFFFKSKDIFPDKATGRKILSFTIKCSSKGCDWTGELREKEVNP